MSDPAPDPAPVITTRVRNAVADCIRALNLPGIGAAKVYVQFAPDSAGIELPAVHVSMDGMTEVEGANGTNEQDEVGFGVQVTVADRLNDPPDPARMARLDRWRRTIDWRFRGRPLDGVPESTVCEVEPGETGRPSESGTIYRTALVVRAYCRVPCHTLV